MEIEFREILKDFLSEKNLTQSDFARQINVKQSQVSEWLKGKCKPGYDVLKSIAHTFNISADYLLGLSENMF
ncbi:MAG: helix-turn-helix transcriptional regulator [Clostridiales bacterium]|nr:helix-turn-helix transcriptional regulator [Clostridiales bacterium]